MQDIPLPSPSVSSSALSSAQPDAETPPYVPVSLNVSGEAEAEVDLAQSSDNTSLPVFPVNTSGICGPVLRSISVLQYVTAVCSEWIERADSVINIVEESRAGCKMLGLSNFVITQDLWPATFALPS